MCELLFSQQTPVIFLYCIHKFFLLKEAHSALCEMCNKFVCELALDSKESHNVGCCYVCIFFTDILKEEKGVLLWTWKLAIYNYRATLA
jgi:hypothetical protein